MLFLWCPAAEFLEKTQTKVLRVFLLAIHSNLYSFEKSMQKPQVWEISRSRLCAQKPQRNCTFMNSTSVLHTVLTILSVVLPRCVRYYIVMYIYLFYCLNYPNCLCIFITSSVKVTQQTFSSVPAHSNCTVGAQSIAHLGQKYANSLNSISGHRCPRELWFFFVWKILDRRRV